MKARFAKLLIAFGLFALCTFAAAPKACAQGCALCYTTAAAAGAAAARAIDLGILVLLIPALLMFIAVLAFLVRRAA
jgi:uncharacterized membrane protein